MNITAYYHAYLDDNFLWSQLFLEQFKLIEDSGLNKHINKMRMTVITQEDGRVKNFYDLCSLYNIPTEIEFIKNQYNNDFDMVEATGDFRVNRLKNVDERHTIKKIYDDCQNNDQYALYFHTKNIMSIVNNLMPGLVSKYRNRYHWRLFLNKTISEWKDCVAALDSGYDTAGVNYKTDPSEHYSGAFYWTKSDHVRKLPDPTDSRWWGELKARKNHPWLNQINDRFAAELWVCSLPETKAFNLAENNGDYIDNDI